MRSGGRGRRSAGGGIIQRKIVFYLKPHSDNLSLQTAGIAGKQHGLRSACRDRDKFVIKTGFSLFARRSVRVPGSNKLSLLLAMPTFLGLTFKGNANASETVISLSVSVKF